MADCHPDQPHRAKGLCSVCYERKRLVEGKKPQYPINGHKYNLKYTYGLKYGSYEKMLVAQKGTCALCGSPEPTYCKLMIDHSHETGEVRGLLCRTCNQRLGLIEGNWDFIGVAIKYLIAPPMRNVLGEEDFIHEDLRKAKEKIKAEQPRTEVRLEQAVSVPN